HSNNRITTLTLQWSLLSPATSQQPAPEPISCRKYVSSEGLTMSFWPLASTQRLPSKRWRPSNSISPWTSTSGLSFNLLESLSPIYRTEDRSLPLARLPVNEVRSITRTTLPRKLHSWRSVGVSRGNSGNEAYV